MQTPPDQRPSSRDPERVESLRTACTEGGWDALICGLPQNVLMLTGYWPVVGMSIAVVTRDGWVGLLAPEDEREIAARGAADSHRFFRPSALHHKTALRETIRGPLAELLKEGGLSQAKIGLETRHESVPAPYAALHVFAETLPHLLSEILPETTCKPADEELDRVAAVKTTRELQRIAVAAEIAEGAFRVARQELHAGEREIDVAASMRVPLQKNGVGHRGVQRADGFAYCMSGPNASQAYAAYQRSRDRVIQEGDLALVHVNSYADGYWTDVTRTLPVSEVPDESRKVLRAIEEARAAALAAIHPGVAARDVDAAARRVLVDHGFGDAFRHGLGHGVGFQAIDHTAQPRLSPTSDDTLQVGMVFNVEPGIYLEDRLGARHCDMVAVTDTGCRILTGEGPSSS